MESEKQNMIDEAIARGRFEGEVLTRLAGISATLTEITKKHEVQDTKIDGKVDRKEYEKLEGRVGFIEKWSWRVAGGFAVFMYVLSKVVN